MLLREMFSPLGGPKEDDEEDIYLKDGALVVEAVKSMLCKYHGIIHPLAIIADELFVPNEDEPGTFKIPENLTININTKSKNNPFFSKNSLTLFKL